MLNNVYELDHFLYKERSEGISIEVLPYYLEEKSNPAENHYFFAYQVQITNYRDETVKLLSRQWIIRDGLKKEKFIHGEGVVGKKPILDPGESFQYQSFCPLLTPTGNMRGKYRFVIWNEKTAVNTEAYSENQFWCPVPLFFFRMPGSFHRPLTDMNL